MLCWDTDFLLICISVSEEHQYSHQVTSYLEVSELTKSALCTSPLQGSSPGQAHLLMHIVLQTHPVTTYFSNSHPFWSLKPLPRTTLTPGSGGYCKREQMVGTSHLEQPKPQVLRDASNIAPCHAFPMMAFCQCLRFHHSKVTSVRPCAAHSTVQALVSQSISHGQIFQWTICKTCKLSYPKLNISQRRNNIRREAKDNVLDMDRCWGFGFLT